MLPRRKNSWMFTATWSADGGQHSIRQGPQNTGQGWRGGGRAEGAPGLRSQILTPL